MLAEVVQLYRFLKISSGLLIAGAGPFVDGRQPSLQLTWASIFVQLYLLGQTFGGRSRSEALQIVGDEGRTRKLVRLILQNRSPLLFCHLLEQPLDALGALIVSELVNDATRGIVKQRLADPAQMFVGMCASIQGLDVFRIHGDRCACIFDHLIPLAQNIIAGGSVGVVDRVGLAEEGFAV